MQKVTVLCVGKLKERFYIDAAAEYAKRLSRHCRLEILELPEQRLPEDPTPGEISAALEREAAAVREKLPRGGALVALCVEGKMLSSPELAKRLMDFGLAGQSQLTFLIGGSVGLHPSLKAQADLRLSMSPMTFPHHLARVMLLEQLYRAYQIQAGSRYAQVNSFLSTRRAVSRTARFCFFQIPLEPAGQTCYNRFIAETP